MSRTLSTVVLVAGAAALLGAMTASGLRAVPRMDSESARLTKTYYKCPSGYRFAISGSDAVHCSRAAYTTVSNRTLATCPNVGGVGTFARTDHVRTKDMCTGTNPLTGEIAVERGCWPTDVAAGYRKRIVSGTDRCEKSTYHPEQIRAPSVAVQR